MNLMGYGRWGGLSSGLPNSGCKQAVQTTKDLTNSLCSLEYIQKHTVSMHTQTHDIHSPYIKTCDIHCPCSHKLMTYILPTSKCDIHSQCTHKHMTQILCTQTHSPCTQIHTTFSIHTHTTFSMHANTTFSVHNNGACDKPLPSSFTNTHHILCSKTHHILYTHNDACDKPLPTSFTNT